MKRTIRRLNKALEDPVFRQWWIDQFDKCHVNAESDYKALHEKTRLNAEDRRSIATGTALFFLKRLGK